MKDNCLYLVILIACCLLFLGSLTTDFKTDKPVYEMWISDAAFSPNSTAFNLHVRGHSEEQKIDVLIDGAVFNKSAIAIPSTASFSLPIGQGNHLISIELYDAKKSYDEYGSKAKPYTVFFRTG